MANPNLFAAIETAARRRPDRICLDAGSDGRYSFGDMLRETARIATGLKQLGARPGDRIAVQVEKSPAALFLYLACLRSGLVYLPLNTAYQRGELSWFLGDAAPAIAVCQPQSSGLFAELCAGRSQVLTLDADGGGTLADAARQCSDRFDTIESGPDDLAVLIYTSGTTGRSKGAMVTHRNLLSNAKVLIDFWGFSEDDVLLHALPIFHVHGLFVANHCALMSGAKMLWHARFEAKAIVKDLAQATVMMGVPTFYTRLLADPTFDAACCAGVRLFVSGSAPLLLETFETFRSRTGKSILERYGMSEAGMIASNPLDGERRGGTVGLPLPGVEVRIADDDDQALTNGHTGAIQIRGENVFAGYWNLPEKTRQEFASDGWFRTGDVGMFDADGYLSIVGRAKDLIISGGYNVYPKEIELALDALPGVAESAVVGVPHPDFGEAVIAVVVPRAGVRPEAAALIAEVKKNLANYKVPKQLYFVDALPRNAMGKVQKAALREKYGHG